MIKVCKTTEKDLPVQYLKVLNGILGLTEGEIKLTSIIISKYRVYGKDGLREPYLSKFVFSTDGRKDICAELDGMSNQNLGNKLKQLVDKGVLQNSTEDGYTLHASLLPQSEITFKFEIIDDQSG